MVDAQSVSEARPETRASSIEPKSPFTIYLEQNPQMASQLLNVILQLYQDPVKESEAQA